MVGGCDGGKEKEVDAITASLLKIRTQARLGLNPKKDRTQTSISSLLLTHHLLCFALLCLGFQLSNK
ncbi:hypothetical protein QVD17_09778 [Tagetes erecta]|uniref:Uncharacterized protein n=1 Tax=Tagetes erecta TaxID=13708 RepID=A0AAD8L599_TARER|nr:hypothetical protein QVD17_09778 [Tagetes erecta]